MKLKLLAFILVSIFLLSCVSALEFDNVKSYDSVNKEVIIVNALGLGNDVAKIKLNTPLNVVVPRGYQKVAEFDLTYYLDDNGGLDKIMFYDLKKQMKEIDREFDFKVKEIKQVEVDDYSCIESLNKNGTIEEVCNISGSHYEDKVEWKDFDAKNLVKEEKITIGVFTDVKKGDKVEWIPTFYGVEIDEWATWSEDWSVGNVFYLPLNESSGNAIDVTGNGYDFANTGATYGVSGFIGEGYFFNQTENDYLADNIGTAMSSPDAWTITYWVNAKALGEGSPTYRGMWGLGANPKSVYQVADNQLELSFNSSGTAIPLAQATFENHWHFLVYRWDGDSYNFTIYNDTSYVTSSSGTLGSIAYASTTMNIGSYGDTARDFTGTIDEFSVWNRSLSDAEVLDLWANYILGCGFMDDSCLGSASPVVELNSPENYYNQSNLSDVNMVCYGSDNLNFANMSLVFDGVLNQTNSSGLNNTNYTFSLSLSDGEYDWTCTGTDNESQSTTPSVRYFEIDTLVPIWNNLSSNVSGEIYGYPNSINISDNVSDDNLEACWYNLDYNSSNVSYTCNSGFEITDLIEGNRIITACANDSFGWEICEGLNLTIDYYTHNVSFADNISQAVLTPNCSFDGGVEDGYEYHFDIHNTSLREVECYLEFYGNFTFDLSESNQTQQAVNISVPHLWLVFDDLTDVKINWLGEGLDYTNVSEVKVPMRNLSIGEIQVAFNNETQLYTFTNDNETAVYEEMHIETGDLDQQFKVLSSSNEINGALVKLRKVDNSTEQTTYSAYTNINGIAHILVNDGTTYDLYVTASGYQNYSKLIYIPYSNTETIIVNLLSNEGAVGDYYFSQSCLSYVGIERNCSWYVKSYKDSTITFNYTWNGADYSVQSAGSEATLTLWVNESVTPINVTASVNPTKVYSVLWEGLGDRSIQLEFDETEIKDLDNHILGLFYLIILIIGVLIAVSINRIPKMEGKGIYGLAVWFGVVAIEFPIMWFIVIPMALYFIFKALWGDDD